MYLLHLTGQLWFIVVTKNYFIVMLIWRKWVTCALSTLLLFPTGILFLLLHIYPLLLFLGLVLQCKIRYSEWYSTNVNDLNSLAIAKEGELTIGTIDDIQKLHIRTIPLGEHARRICHQEQTRTFAICSLKYNSASAEESEMHFVRLLDDQTFDFISVYPLDTYEYGCFIISCSFSDDNNMYYCVGTAYVLPEENEPTKVNW